MNNKPTRAEVLEKMMNIKEKAADAVIADKDARIAELEAAILNIGKKIDRETYANIKAAILDAVKLLKG